MSKVTYRIEPYNRDDAITVLKQSDDGTWTMAFYDWNGRIHYYGPQRSRFRTDDVYVSTTEYDTIRPILKSIGKRMVMNNMDSIGLHCIEDFKGNSREFLEAGIIDDRLVVITRRVDPRNEPRIGCRVASVSLQDVRGDDPTGWDDRIRGGWRWTNHDEVMTLNDGIPKLTRGEAVKVAVQAFKDRSDQLRKEFDRFCEVEEGGTDP